MTSYQEDVQPLSDVVVGVDPGVSGWICTIGKAITFTHVPLLAGGGKSVYDVRGMFELVKSFSGVRRVVVERQSPRPVQGVVSAFAMGRGFGLWEMAFQASGVPVTFVNPQAWKKSLGLQAHKDPKVRKKYSIQLAQQLFPSVDLRESEKCRVPHDGKAEALLIAEYARRLG